MVINGNKYKYKYYIYGKYIIITILHLINSIGNEFLK